MDQPPKKRSRLGSILTTTGGVLGVLGVIIMRIGLKVTISPDNNDVTIIRGVVSVGGAIVFGIAVAMIVAGAIVGRRKTAPSNDEGPVEHQAQTDPLLSDAFGFPDAGAISTYDSTTRRDESSSSSGSSS